MKINKEEAKTCFFAFEFKEREKYIMRNERDATGQRFQQ